MSTIKATDVLDPMEFHDFLSGILNQFGDDDAGVTKAILFLGASKAVLEKALGVKPVEFKLEDEDVENESTV
ncbi:hypothetical protein D3C80_387980 [compost metagenome]